MTELVRAPDWLGRTRVLVVVGKGGVGTSTVAASLALLAATGGADVLLVAVDGKPGLGPLLGGSPLGADEQTLRLIDRNGGRVRGRTVSPEQAFGDYLELKGFGGLMRRVASAASFDVIAGSTPGMQHLLVLGKIKELDRVHAADLIIVEVSALLADHHRSQCVMVTLPEETPVNEVIELAHDLEDELGLAMAPLVVNACWPDRPGLALKAATAARQQHMTLPLANRRALDEVVRFGRMRVDRQREQLARLDELLPLPRILLPRLPVARLRPAHLDVLAAALAVEPSLAGTKGRR